MSSQVFLGTYLILYNQHRTQKRPIMTYFCYWIANDFALIMIYLLTCKISKNDIFLYISPKKSFLFFMGDEHPYAHDSKFMIGFVPTAQQLTL